MSWNSCGSLTNRERNYFISGSSMMRARWESEVLEVASLKDCMRVERRGKSRGEEKRVFNVAVSCVN